MEKRMLMCCLLWLTGWCAVVVPSAPTRICPLLVAPQDCSLPTCCTVLPEQTIAGNTETPQMSELWGSLEVSPGPVIIQGDLPYTKCSVGKMIEGVVSFNPSRDALYIVFDDDCWRAAPASVSLSFVSSVRPVLSVFNAFGWDREVSGYYNWVPMQYDADGLLVHPKQTDCFNIRSLAPYNVFNYVNRNRACGDVFCGGRYAVGETTYPHVSKFFKCGSCFDGWADLNMCIMKPARNVVGLRLYPCVDADFYNLDPCAQILRKPTTGEALGVFERSVSTASCSSTNNCYGCFDMSPSCSCCSDGGTSCEKSCLLLDRDLCERLKTEKSTKKKPLVADPVTAVEIDQGVLYYQICSSNLADQCGGLNPYKVDVMVGDVCIANALQQLGCSPRECCSILRQLCKVSPPENKVSCCLKAESPCLRSTTEFIETTEPIKRVATFEKLEVEKSEPCVEEEIQPEKSVRELVESILTKRKKKRGE